MEIAGCSFKLRAQSEEDTGDKGHDVVSNDDLLIEILLRLPIISIQVFKFVSKRWLTLITSPVFTLRRSQIPKIDAPLGFFFRQPQSYVRYHFVPFDSRITDNKSLLQANFTFVPEAVKSFTIVQSCNGLLLSYIKRDKFYVYNPSNNLFKMLPKCHYPQPFSLPIMKISFEPTKSLHYKVVCAEYRNDDSNDDFAQVQTYSSDTGIWSICGERFETVILEYFKDGIYWNGAIHMLTSMNGSTHFKLDIVEHPTLTTIQTPVNLDGIVECHCRLFKSRGCLLLFRSFYTESKEFSVYEIENESSGWSVKYLINLDDAIMLFPNPSKMHDRCICCSLWGVVLEEKEEDSFLVMELYGKIVQYKFILETLSTLCDIGSVRPITDCFEFFPSFARVAGANNDLTVLNNSLLFDNLLDDIFLVASFKVNGVTFPSGYYLAEGIYPRWASFVKLFTIARDEKTTVFKRRQEGARKDVERAFGVLQRRWEIIQQLTRAYLSTSNENSCDDEVTN
ncbi:F-box protein-like protein isoform X1 [Tanacetum coccineum]